MSVRYEAHLPRAGSREADTVSEAQAGYSTGAAPDSGNVTSTRTLQSGRRVKRLVINLDEDLHRQLRREALEADQSLTAYVTSILEQRQHN